MRPADISHALASASAGDLAEGIAANTVLTVLHLRVNNVSRRGATSLAAALGKNSALRFEERALIPPDMRSSRSTTLTRRTADT